MSRPLRIEYPGACYHVYSRGNERKDIFRSPIDYELFLGILKDASQLYGFLVHAWCLMPNHFHIIKGSLKIDMTCQVLIASPHALKLRESVYFATFVGVELIQADFSVNLPET